MAVTVGIPVLGAVMAIRADLLAGIQLALAADVVLTLTAVVIIWAGLNRSRPVGGASIRDPLAARARGRLRTAVFRACRHPRQHIRDRFSD